MKKFNEMTKRDIVKRALELYPESKHKRRLWARQTYALINNGRHAFLTGGFRLPGFKA